MNGRYLFLPLAALFALSACDQSNVPVASDPASTTSLLKNNDDGDLVPGQYIVQMNDNVSATAVDALADDFSHGNGRHVGQKFKHGVKGFVLQMSANDAATLSYDARVKRIEQDRYMEIDPTAKASRRPGSGSTTPPSTQVTPWGVSNVGGPHDGTGKRCWIIDTGIDLTNPDLNIDLTLSRNFSTGTSATDGYGHGTHVAGIVGAKNNTIGVVGVAPNTTLVAVRVFDNAGATTTSTVIAGIDYVTATATSGDVANLSLGGGASPALDDAVIRLGNAGVLVSLAAGNSSADANLTSPARVNGTNIYTVSAFDENGRLATFSNYGNPPIDWSAPGTNILSTAIGGGTVYKSGTSMAAPHVAGLLVLGSIHGNGTITGDRDATPDTKAHY